MATSYVRISATVSAINVKATTSVVQAAASVGAVLIAVAIFVGAPWLGYAYDYFAENYTTVTT